MKVAISFVVIIGSVLGAPTEDWGVRNPKSAPVPYGVSPSYGSGIGAGVAGSYGAPCSGAPLAPIALYLAPQGAIGPHYREDLPEDHAEHARSSYAAPAIASSYGASSGLLAPAGAVGVFPHARVGGCGVPLLLSCSPQVVTGHLSKSYASSPAYKTTENKELTTELKEAAMEKSWSHAEREAGHHHHHVLALPDGHLGEHLEHNYNGPI